MPGDAVSSTPTAGSYAPPPSASYMTAWNEGSQMLLVRMRSQLCPTLTLQQPPDLRPICHPLIKTSSFCTAVVDHTADFGWLFDGVDPFGGSTLAAVRVGLPTPAVTHVARSPKRRLSLQVARTVSADSWETCILLTTVWPQAVAQAMHPASVAA